MAAEADDLALRGGDEVRLPRLTGVLGPLVDAVARIRASVHTKLLVGFLVVGLLLIGMGLLSTVVIARMTGRVDELKTLETKIALAAQMKFDVTAQSHYRAMALLTKDDLKPIPVHPTNNEKIALAKQDFGNDLDQIEKLSSPSDAAFFAKVRSDNDKFNSDSAQVLALYQAGQYDKALQLHLGQEHPDSHVLETDMKQLNQGLLQRWQAARLAYDSDRQLLTATVGVFSIVSLALALLLGFTLSWSLIRPVRKIDTALAKIAAGDFHRRVQVPNRDEFGTLTRNLNSTSVQLATLYAELKDLNVNLQDKVAAQLEEIKRASELKRYLSPQLAESILAGTIEVNLGSRRKNLTVFFSDIRGFTEMSERVEPEELVDSLNQYLSGMTELVFKYGGTLDKYIGDAIMVFFGDPISYDDHAQRAVQMALEMRQRLAELQRQWFVDQREPLTVGMGISTGYVTVGNIGSSGRMEYTVVGNHVNLASRLAGKAAAGQILVAERTLLACREIVEAREVDEVELKGVSRPIKIYDVNERAPAIV
jgi:class 3 adenylate cyclase/HAMP domain-containing protein